MLIGAHAVMLLSRVSKFFAEISQTMCEVSTSCCTQYYAI